jgi:uncharacterized protein (TIGR02145 family)
MRKTAIIVVVAASVLTVCGCKDAKDKAVPAADTVADTPDTDTADTDTVAAVPDTVAADTPSKPVAKKPKPVITTFTDRRDGKVYRKVEINGQVWMAENLNYAGIRSACYENKADSCSKYGCLYNWATALKACPAGYHLPSDKEWKTLTSYVGSNAGTKLKSPQYWISYIDSDSGVPAGSYEYEFSALPGGYGCCGRFINAGYEGNWWSATAPRPCGACPTQPFNAVRMLKSMSMREFSCNGTCKR